MLKRCRLFGAGNVEIYLISGVVWVQQLAFDIQFLDVCWLPSIFKSLVHVLRRVIKFPLEFYFWASTFGCERKLLILGWEWGNRVGFNNGFGIRIRFQRGTFGFFNFRQYLKAWYRSLVWLLNLISFFTFIWCYYIASFPWYLPTLKRKLTSAIRNWYYVKDFRASTI